MKHKNLRRPQKYWIFYLLIGYMVAVFLWWWFLLFNRNQELFKERNQILYYRYQQEDSGALIKESEALENDYQRQKWMLVGEGATFIFLLMLGIYRLRVNILKEIAMADQQRNFLLSITHELKSPIAGARLSMQTLAKRALSPEQQSILIKNAEEDISRLNDLVEKILLSAKMEDHKIQLSSTEFNLSMMVIDVVELAKRRWSNVQFSDNIQEDIWIAGDEVMLESLLLNLLENAVKYSPENHPVEIFLKKSDDEIQLEVRDFGKAIPEEEREKIFSRFYRIGNEETRTTTGVGLGLYIVKQVALLHDGDVHIETIGNGSKSFVVHLPAISAEI